MPAPQEVLRDLVVGIDHIGLAVPDLDKAIKNWTDNFGGYLHSREVNEEQAIEEAMIQFADGTQIQLLSALNPDSVISRFLAKQGPGVQQVAFRVRDLNQAMLALSANNIPTVYPVGKRGGGGSSINFIHPKYTGGVLIELVEYSS